MDCFLYTRVIALTYHYGMGFEVFILFNLVIIYLSACSVYQNGVSAAYKKGK